MVFRAVMLLGDSDDIADIVLTIALSEKEGRETRLCTPHRVNQLLGPCSPGKLPLKWGKVTGLARQLIQTPSPNPVTVSPLLSDLFSDNRQRRHAVCHARHVADSLLQESRRSLVVVRSIPLAQHACQRYLRTYLGHSPSTARTDKHSMEGSQLARAQVRLDQG